MTGADLAESGSSDDERQSRKEATDDVAQVGDDEEAQADVHLRHPRPLLDLMNLLQKLQFIQDS